MEVVKWLFSLVVGLAAAAFGLCVVVGSMLLGAAVQIAGLIALLVAGITVAVKEFMDERSGK